MNIIHFLTTNIYVLSFCYVGARENEILSSLHFMDVSEIYSLQTIDRGLGVAW